MCMNILMYHNISNRFEASFRSISSNLLEKHLKSLEHNGKKILKKHEILSGVFLSRDDSVVITFDDAYEGVYYSALPVMEKHNATGVVFIPAGYVGKFNDWDFSPLRRLKHMDEKMLINLSKKGWIIGSHSFTHPDLRKCSNEALKREICESKKKIEDIIGEEITLFAYPFGLYNQKVIDIVAECGYKYAFATAGGLSGNRFAIKRMAVYFIDRSPLPLLNERYYSLYLFRNRIIAAFASLTPIYKRLSGIRKIQR